MGPRPEGCTLDRLDNDGPYSKDNCAWKTATEQGANTRFNVRYSFNGELLTLPEAARKYGITVATLRSRICQRNWEPDEAISEALKTFPNRRPASA